VSYPGTVNQVNDLRVSACSAKFDVTVS